MWPRVLGRREKAELLSLLVKDEPAHTPWSLKVFCRLEICGAAEEEVLAPAVRIHERYPVLQFYSLRLRDSTNLSFAVAVPPGRGLGTLAHYTALSQAGSVLWIKTAFQSSVGSV